MRPLYSYQRYVSLAQKNMECTCHSTEEHRDIAADVAQAIVTGVDVLVIAQAGQRDEDDDEGRLHHKPGQE